MESITMTDIVSYLRERFREELSKIEWIEEGYCAGGSTGAHPVKIWPELMDKIIAATPDEIFTEPLKLEKLTKHNYFYSNPPNNKTAGFYYCLCGWEGRDRISYWTHLKTALVKPAELTEDEIRRRESDRDKALYVEKENAARRDKMSYNRTANASGDRITSRIVKDAVLYGREKGRPFSEEWFETVTLAINRLVAAPPVAEKTELGQAGRGDFYVFPWLCFKCGHGFESQLALAVHIIRASHELTEEESAKLDDGKIAVYKSLCKLKGVPPMSAALGSGQELRETLTAFNDLPLRLDERPDCMEVAIYGKPHPVDGGNYAALYRGGNKEFARLVVAAVNHCAALALPLAPKPSCEWCERGTPLQNGKHQAIEGDYSIPCTAPQACAGWGARWNGIRCR